MNHILFSPDKNAEVDLNSLDKVTNASHSYFDVITQRLDSWHASQQAIKQQKEQLTVVRLVKETDPVTNITRTFRLTVELVRTEQADDLEVMEVNSYVS